VDTQVEAPKKFPRFYFFGKNALPGYILTNTDNAQSGSLRKHGNHFLEKQSWISERCLEKPRSQQGSRRYRRSIAMPILMLIF
jgi:hypothetical protein